MNRNVTIGADINAGDGGYSLGTKEKYDEFVKGRNQSLGKMRIKELAEQATTYIEPTSNSGEGWIFDKEKFAQLIVKECALQCIHNEDMDLIEKHFGVAKPQSDWDQEAAEFIATENKKVASRYGYFPKLHPSEWQD